MSKKHNWPQLKVEYVTANLEMSVKDLAEKHSTPRDTIAARCTKEHWVDARKEYWRKITEKATKKAAKDEERRIRCVWGIELDAAEKLGKIILGAINEEKQFNTRFVKVRNYQESDTYMDVETEVIDADRIDKLASALERIEGVKRRTKDIVSGLEKAKTDVEKEKLALLRAQNGDTGVVGADIKVEFEAGWQEVIDDMP